MSDSIRRFSVWLDAIRGLAALVVFAGHARVVLIGSIIPAGRADAPGVNAAAKAAAISPQLTSYGHMAVVVFFVLSGYLVGGGAIRAVREDRWSTSGYVIQRFSRLWTVLIPVLALGYLLDHVGVAMARPGSIYSAPAGQAMVFPSLPEAMTFPNLIANLFFLQGILGIPFGTNSPLWTLAYEFWFYMAFPLLLFVFAPRRTLGQRALSAALLAAIGLFVGWRISFYFLFWLIGAAIELTPRRLSPETARRLSYLGIPLFLSVLVVILKLKPHIFVADAIESTAFAVWCWAIVQMRDLRSHDLTVAAASGLSAVSYTLYLVHAPIIAFVSSLVQPVWSPWPVNAEGLVKFGLTTALIFGIVVLLWWLFEHNTPKVRQLMTKLWERS